ncbi:MAG: tyrosine-type recombinase/integrase [Eubacteriales bacterium]|nr:tyrosine-type recombinase/integrase [Eubacteriales bacterium]
MEYQMGEEKISNFCEYLYREECSRGTIEKYVRDIKNFYAWLDGRGVNKENAAKWKEHLLEKGYAPVTINSMVSAVNRFFRFAGWEECHIKFLHIQRKMFREQSKELTRNEYKRLLKAAGRQGNERLELAMETICSTGIRVSEVRYITVEAAKRGRTEISLKGKIRTILIPDKLCRKLLKFAEKQKNTSGEIFLTRSGNHLSRHQIWYEMKKLCKSTGIEPSKVFPHNLRHLFAATFYRVCSDIVKLADILGHSSIDTTRIYLISTGAEHAQQMARLGLLS